MTPPRSPDHQQKRQTLRRLPETDAVVFTIRTQQVSMSILEHRPDIAAALADRLAAQPDELGRYAAYSAHVPALIHRLTTWRN